MTFFNSYFSGTLGTLLFLGNAITCISLLVYAFVRRDQLGFWAPLTYVAAIFMYYCVIGPLVIINTSEYVDRGNDMRPYLTDAWAGSLVALVSLMTGYWVHWTRRRRGPAQQTQYTVTNRDIKTIAILLLVLGFTGFALVIGEDIIRYINPYSWSQDPAATSTTGYTGAFANYFGLSLNFMIPGTALIMLLYLRGSTKLFVLVAVIATCTLVFVTIGFRYRLVLLYTSLMFVYYITQKRRPHILSLAGGLLAALAVLGEIGTMRRYSEGLDFSAHGDAIGDSFISAFGEAGIFGTSGAVIAMVPEVRPFAGLEPFKQTLLMPLPSKIYTSKDSAGYTRETLMVIYGTSAYEGAAYMSFAEAYLSYGWAAIVVSHFLLGWLCRWIWQWYLDRQHNPMALLVYGAAVPFLYVVFSRGYLPQITMLFAFSVLPAIIIYRWPKRVAILAGNLTSLPRLRRV